MVRRLLSVLAVTLFLLPLTFVLTFMLTPLWSWIESRYGIESLGHSGPADWCFYAIYGLCLAGCFLTWLVWRRRRRSSTPDHSQSSSPDSNP